LNHFTLPVIKSTSWFKVKVKIKNPPKGETHSPLVPFFFEARFCQRAFTLLSGYLATLFLSGFPYSAFLTRLAGSENPIFFNYL